MTTINAISEEVYPPLTTDSLSDIIAEPLAVLWDECNMKQDSLGVLSCYRMLSDLSEQNYYYLDGREYDYYPIPKE